MSGIVRSVRHSGIVVNDLELSLRFYRDLLGFTIVKQREEAGAYIDALTGLSSVAVTTVKMKAGDGQLIELLRFGSHPQELNERALNAIGITHLALSVDDIDRAYAALRAAGVVFISPPQRSPDGYAKVAFCRAPEGTYIELVEVL